MGCGPSTATTVSSPPRGDNTPKKVPEFHTIASREAPRRPNSAPQKRATDETESMTSLLPFTTAGPPTATNDDLYLDQLKQKDPSAVGRARAAKRAFGSTSSLPTRGSDGMASTSAVAFRDNIVSQRSPACDSNQSSLSQFDSESYTAGSPIHLRRTNTATAMGSSQEEDTLVQTIGPGEL